MRSESEKSAQRKYRKKKESEGFIWVSFFVPNEIRESLIRAKQTIIETYNEEKSKSNM
jgi:hypothetical protein